MSDEIYSLSATCTIVYTFPLSRKWKSKREKEKGIDESSIYPTLCLGGVILLIYPLSFTTDAIYLSSYHLPFYFSYHYCIHALKSSLCISSCLLPVNIYSLNLCCI